MSKKTRTIGGFPFKYWLVIFFEFVERGSYYGVMSILSIYLTDNLGFSKEGVGVIKSTIQPLLYFLPIITGAIADRVGFRKTLMVAFSILGLGYILTSQFDTYAAVFASLVIMGIGAGTFKPIISGTIASVTNEKNSSLGFGIFYWSINLGAFLFPMFVVPTLKAVNPAYIPMMAGLATAAMVIPTFFLFKDDKKEEKSQEPLGVVLSDIFNKVMEVVKDWRFILFIFIYSFFWILYFQMFDTVLWYVKMFVDPAPLNSLVNNLLGTDWHFDVEHVTVINAFTIIVLQLFISALVRKAKPLPTMIIGISFGIIGMGILSLSQSIWIFLAGITIFSLGEMTAHPKYIAYLGSIAPADKKATYMGFGFLYGFFGSFFAGISGALLYVSLVDNPMLAYVKSKVATVTMDTEINSAIDIAVKEGIPKAEILAQANTSELWLVFCGIGVLCIIGLLLYNKFIGVRSAENLS